MNPRVSRSSALASKATGYPIARIAAKIAIGYHLDEMLNPVTGTTYASFEPALDYIVVKIPAFPFDKFTEADATLGTQMKATGEVMAIDRTFEAALNKSLRSMDMNIVGLNLPKLKQYSDGQLDILLEQANDIRIYAIAEALQRGVDINHIHSLTGIDYWFLDKIKGMVHLMNDLFRYTWQNVPLDLLKRAKLYNTGDAHLSSVFDVPEKVIRARWEQNGWRPSYKLVDTCAAEFDAVTPYYYSTWHGQDEVDVSDKKKIVVIG